MGAHTAAPGKGKRWGGERQGWGARLAAITAARARAPIKTSPTTRRRQMTAKHMKEDRDSYGGIMNIMKEDQDSWVRLARSARLARIAMEASDQSKCYYRAGLRPIAMCGQVSEKDHLMVVAWVHHLDEILPHALQPSKLRYHSISCMTVSTQRRHHNTLSKVSGSNSPHSKIKLPECPPSTGAILRWLSKTF